MGILKYPKRVSVSRFYSDVLDDIQNISNQQIITKGGYSQLNRISNPLYIIQIIMAKIITKNDYYKTKNIPPIVYCKKLAPQISLKNHVLDPLPRLVTEVKKIYSNYRHDNEINLELSNALKIIQELEDELDILNSQKMEMEELYFSTSNEKQELSRVIETLRNRISDLQGLLQKNEFNLKISYEKQVQKHKYELREHLTKISQLQEENRTLQQNSNLQKQQIIHHHKKQLSILQQQNQSLQNHSNSNFKNLEANYVKINSENAQFRKKIFELQERNQQQIQELRNQLEEQFSEKKTIKLQYEQVILELRTQSQILNSTVKESQSKVQVLEARLLRENEGWVSHKNQWVRTLNDNESIWREKVQYILKEKEKIVEELNHKSREINELGRQISNLDYELKKVTIAKEQLSKKLQQKDQEKQQIRKQLGQNFNRELQIREKELIQSIEHQLNFNNNAKLENLRHQLYETHQAIRLKLSNKISQLEHDKSNTEHNNRLLQDQLKKQKFKIEALTQEISFRKSREEENKHYHQTKLEELENNYEGQLKKVKQFQSQSMSTLKRQYQNEIESLRQYFNQEKSELYSQIDQTIKEKKKAEDQQNKLKQKFENDQMSFIEQIQSLTKRVQNMNKYKQGADSERQKLEESLKLQHDKLSEIEYLLQQEQNTNQQLCREFKEVCMDRQEKQANLRNSIEQNMKLVNQRKQMTIQKDRLKMVVERETEQGQKREQQLLERIKELQKEIKCLQTQKINLRQGIIKNDEETKIHWQRVRNQFNEITQKYSRQAQSREKQVANIIQQLKKQNKQLQKQLDQQLQELSSQKSSNNSVISQWMSKYSAIESRNKKMEIQVNQLKEIANQSVEKDKRIHRLTQIQEQSQTQINKLKLEIKELNHTVECLEFEQEKLANNQTKVNLALENSGNRIANLQSERNGLLESNRKLQYELDIRMEERSEEITKVKLQLRKVGQILEEERAKSVQQFSNLQSSAQQKEAFLKSRIQELHHQNKQEKNQLQKQVSKLRQINSELEEDMKKIGNQTQYLLTQKNNQYESINRKHQELEITVIEYENRLKQVHQNFNSNRTQYEKQRNKNIQLTKDIKQVTIKKKELEQQLMKLRIQIQTKTRMLEKSEQDIKKIYQENDQRLQEYRKDYMDCYNSDLIRKSDKIKMLEEARHQAEENVRKLSEDHHQEIKKLKKNANNKSAQSEHRINQLTIENEELERKCAASASQLAYLRAKWQRFYQSQLGLQQEVHGNHQSVNQQRTQEKRMVKKKYQSTITTSNRKIRKQIIHRSIHDLGTELVKSEQLITPAFEKKQITKLLDSDSDVINSRSIHKSEVEDSKPEHNLSSYSSQQN